MAPRPRPADRSVQLAMPRHENLQRSKALLAKQARPKATDFFDLSEPEGPALAHSITARPQKARNESDDDDTSIDSDRDKEDFDAPRVAQWMDDEDLELQEQTDDVSGSGPEEEEDDDDDHSASEPGPSRKLRSLEEDLSTLPLGTLRSAQRSLAQAQALSDTEPDSEVQSEGDFGASEDDDPSPRPTKGKHAEKPDEPSKPKNGANKRANKHAPVEVTSKRPVSRRRVVVDDKLPNPRDPRFMHAAGRYDPSKFKQHYDFLPSLRNDELATLREHVQRARKLLVNSPSHLRAEREEEVKRLERAMKRAESAVNLDNRERAELKALQSAKQAEKEKRKEGKAGWWMKRSEKKQLLAEARLDAIASVGGKRAVKKALEKKQKKISQKEKKKRPISRSEVGIEQLAGKRRRPIGSLDTGRGTKRRKVV